MKQEQAGIYTNVAWRMVVTCCCLPNTMEWTLKNPSTIAAADQMMRQMIDQLQKRGDTVNRQEDKRQFE